MTPRGTGGALALASILAGCFSSNVGNDLADVGVEQCPRGAPSACSSADAGAGAPVRSDGFDAGRNLSGAGAGAGGAGSGRVPGAGSGGAAGAGMGSPGGGGAAGAPVVVLDAGSPIPGPDPVDAGPQPPVNALAGCDSPGAYDPLVPVAGETCYDLRVHAVSDPEDSTPFTVRPGEAYHQLYYDVPWPQGSLGSRFGSDFDNLAVLHSWRLFSSTASIADGTVQMNVTGTTLGEDARLLAAWHVGGCNMMMPSDVGMELPSAGKLMVQLHVHNATGAPQPDATHVQICTVPPGARPNVASITWLGTENLNGIAGMPAGENAFTSTCRNDSISPISIFAFRPHMHLLGVQMRSDIVRASGGREVIFDQPFSFDYQIHYPLEPRPALQPADAVETTCSYFNDTGSHVAFGESTHMEMCFQLAYAYPARALDNAVLSLTGALNTCWAQ